MALLRQHPPLLMRMYTQKRIAVYTAKCNRPDHNITLLDSALNVDVTY